MKLWVQVSTSAHTHFKGICNKDTNSNFCSFLNMWSKIEMDSGNKKSFILLIGLLRIWGDYSKQLASD